MCTSDISVSSVCLIKASSNPSPTMLRARSKKPSPMFFPSFARSCFGIVCASLDMFIQVITASRGVNVLDLNNNFLNIVAIFRKSFFVDPIIVDANVPPSTNMKDSACRYVLISVRNSGTPSINVMPIVNSPMIIIISIFLSFYFFVS